MTANISFLFDYYKANLDLPMLLCYIVLYYQLDYLNRLFKELDDMNKTSHQNTVWDYWVMKNYLECEKNSRYKFCAWYEMDCFDPDPDYGDDGDDSSDDE